MDLILKVQYKKMQDSREELAGERINWKSKEEIYE